MKRKQNKKGFTLVELLVVIAILAILASVSVVGYLSFTKKAKESKALQEMTQVKEVIRDSLLDGTTYSLECGEKDYTIKLVDGKVVTTETQTSNLQTIQNTFEELKGFANLKLNATGISLEYEGLTATWIFANDSIEIK